MPRNTERYPAMNPPGLEPDRKPPPVGEQRATTAPPPEHAPKPEELSVEKLKAEIFDREVPEEYKGLIERGPSFVRDPIQYANHFAATVLDDNVYQPWKYAIPDEVQDDGVTEFGRLIKECMIGKTVIDLGAGHGGAYIRGLARLFHAERYIGVDRYYSMKGWAGHDKSGFDIYQIGDDMLSFVSKMKDENKNLIVYIGGIEYLDGDEIEGRLTREYCDALLQEIGRTMQTGDTLIFGPGTSAPFYPEKFAFKKIISRKTAGPDMYERGWIQVWEKE